MLPAPLGAHGRSREVTRGQRKVTLHSLLATVTRAFSLVQRGAKVQLSDLYTCREIYEIKVHHIILQGAAQRLGQPGQWCWGGQPKRCPKHAIISIILTDLILNQRASRTGRAWIARCSIKARIANQSSKTPVVFIFWCRHYFLKYIYVFLAREMAESWDNLEVEVDDDCIKQTDW